MAFYRALGFEERGRLNFDTAYNVYMGLPGGGDTLELTVNEDREAPYDLGDGYNHVALAVPDLDTLLGELAAIGVEPEKPPFHPGRARGVPHLLRGRPGRLPRGADRRRRVPDAAGPAEVLTPGRCLSARLRLPPRRARHGAPMAFTRTQRIRRIRRMAATAAVVLFLLAWAAVAVLSPAAATTSRQGGPQGDQLGASGSTLDRPRSSTSAPTPPLNASTSTPSSSRPPASPPRRCRRGSRDRAPPLPGLLRRHRAPGGRVRGPPRGRHRPAARRLRRPAAGRARQR